MREELGASQSSRAGLVETHESMYRPFVKKRTIIAWRLTLYLPDCVVQTISTIGIQERGNKRAGIFMEEVKLELDL